MSRVPLNDAEDLPEEYRYLFDSDLGELNLFRALANVPPIMQSYMRYGNTLWEECGLSFRERELVILAVARVIEAEYEWHQHVPIGREAGLTDEEMGALSRGELAGFDDRERALVRYAQAVVDDEVSDDDHEALAAVADDRTVTGTALLAGHYLMTARALSALDVPLESEFVGWDPSA